MSSSIEVLKNQVTPMLNDYVTQLKNPPFTPQKLAQIIVLKNALEKLRVTAVEQHNVQESEFSEERSKTIIADIWNIMNPEKQEVPGEVKQIEKKLHIDDSKKDIRRSIESAFQDTIASGTFLQKLGDYAASFEDVILIARQGKEAAAVLSQALLRDNNDSILTTAEKQKISEVIIPVTARANAGIKVASILNKKGNVRFDKTGFIKIYEEESSTITDALTKRREAERQNVEAAGELKGNKASPMPTTQSQSLFVNPYAAKVESSRKVIQAIPIHGCVYATTMDGKIVGLRLSDNATDFSSIYAEAARMLVQPPDTFSLISKE